MRLHWETKNFNKYTAINKTKKGYCLNVCTQKKQLKKLGTLKQLREEIANITYRYYQHALQWHRFHKNKAK